MRIKRLQNKIAESRWALPFTALYTIVVCLLMGFFSRQLWIQAVALILSALLMMVMNNVNALLRIYSRMVSCSFLVMSCAISRQFLTVQEPLTLFPQFSGGSALVMVCTAAFFVIFFRAYQNKRAAGTIFYAFLMLGIASVGFVQILYFVPIIWILLMAQIMAFSGRTFWASLVGLITPYWFIGVWFIFKGDFTPLWNHFAELGQFMPLFHYETLTIEQIVAFAYLAVLALIGSIHFLRNSYQDKIRTRMLYEVFITMAVCILLFLILQPQHYAVLMGMLIVCTAPLIAHFIALTHTWLTNIAFCLIIIVSLLITAYNVWTISWIS